MLRQLVEDRRFAIVDLILVLISGAVWMLKPEWGFWSLLTALLPWLLRLVSGKFPFQRTSFDWLVSIFLVTAWVGYWAAYDKTTAWSKVWLIVMAILLYYALSAQPKDNLEWISFLLFGFGVGVAVYFFLTHDFVSLPRKLEFVNVIGRWIMMIRPQLGWKPIHPNYVSGLVAITTPFVYYPIWKLNKQTNRYSFLIYVLTLIGVGLTFFALIMATSRGVGMAIVSAGGVWFLWRITTLSRSNPWLKREVLFSSLVVLYLCAIIVLLYTGPSKLVSAISGPDSYGTGSRLELFTRSLYFLKLFPITGGGLGSFPGLYSYYMLGIPFFYLPNSHNLFLDVAIEQGLLGGISFLFVFFSSVWLVSRATVKEQAADKRVFAGLILLALVIAIVHGMVDDYLYNGKGAFLCLFLAALSTNVQYNQTYISYRMSLRTIGLVLFLLIYMLIFNCDKLVATWYADLGAVQMSQVELVDFPNSGWIGDEILPKLEKAEASFHSSLQLDPVNQTSNYYLGLISMLRTDFKPASMYLEKGYERMPYNRGIIKSLGYCYVWLGDTESAKVFLSQIPEAQDELGNYVWWWSTRGRSDLSEKASLMISALKLSSGKP